MPNTTEILNEPVFTPAELSKRLRLHPSTVRKLFVDQPGVIRLGHARSRRTRQYLTLRIPVSVVERVLQQMAVSSNAGGLAISTGRSPGEALSAGGVS